MSATENSLYVIGSEAQIQMVYQSYKFRVLFTSVGLLLEKSLINASYKNPSNCDKVHTGETSKYKCEPKIICTFSITYL